MKTPSLSRYAGLCHRIAPACESQNMTANGAVLNHGVAAVPQDPEPEVDPEPK
eukprot:COSAG02_NODE_61173_length_269_cov_0.717647_2_plen_52_part_01